MNFDRPKRISPRSFADVFGMTKEVSNEVKLNELNFTEVSESNTKLKAIFEQAPIGIAYCTMEGVFVEANKGYSDILGYSQDEIKGKSYRDFTSENDLAINNQFNREINQGVIDFFSMDKRYIKKDGTMIWANVKISKIRFSPEQPEHLMAIMVDITDRKNAENILEHMVFHDRETNLYNRRYFEENIHLHNTEDNLPLSVLVINVNNLKLVNDAFGFASGDVLLNKVARILESVCVSSKMISRINGNEFVAVYTKLDTPEIENIVSLINKAVEFETIENIKISVSIGYAMKFTANQEFSDVYRLAETKMQKEKAMDKNGVMGHTIDIIINSLYEKSNREMHHSKRVSLICQQIATEMHLDPKSIEKLRIAGLLHDIGKIGIPDRILNKGGALADDEWFEIKKHSEAGFRILSSATEFAEIADCVLTHHERWDGSGYPKGLSGSDIPFFSRIIALADAFDAMTSKRSYRDGMPFDRAVEEIKRNSGIQFDPTVVKSFLSSYGSNPDLYRVGY
jgi:PAS domain S-box-containing protein/diguanylate cyclase (GGDEF)-like protein/putative nucleotidyltransferase with HDIG domain